jgi:hypothetical protein
LVAKLFRPLRADLTFAVSDENNIAFFKAGLLEALQGGVQWRLKISPSARKIFRQVQHALGFDFIMFAGI